jgi:hypothetical protein
VRRSLKYPNFGLLIDYCSMELYLHIYILLMIEPRKIFLVVAIATRSAVKLYDTIALLLKKKRRIRMPCVVVDTIGLHWQ